VASVLRAEATKTVAPDSPAAEADGRPSVVKIKRFDMLPMFEEDAITQMEELGHAFFVYLDAETDAVAVLYRRSDGSYGVIEPVIGSGRSR
jgi:putative sigma-54 modulation protein